MPKYDDRKIRELAEQLKGTTHSVYDVAPGVLGLKSVGSSVHKELARAGVFQCERCDLWKPTSEQSEVLSPLSADLCRDCVKAEASSGR